MERESGRRFKMQQTAIPMKVNMPMIRKMVKELLFGKVEMSIKEAMLMMTEKDMAKCFGQMALHIRVNGKKEYSMDLVR